MNMKLSVIIPACNEAPALKKILPLLLDRHPAAEIIVVNDGSSDATAEVGRNFPVTVIDHPYQKGNGAAIKTGARAATGDVCVFMDADGQHRPEEIDKLLDKINDDYDMAIGARDFNAHASLARGLANGFYNWLAGKVTGHRIDDLTSGFRAARSDRFREFINILPNGFSYPTTITMAFLRTGYSVGFIPVEVASRKGKSHIKLIRDGVKFLLIIFRVGVLYSPLKIFFPISALIFSSGLGYYLYTYLSQGRFTNMGILLFITSVFVFLVGLVSEQITFLIYSQNKK